MPLEKQALNINFSQGLDLKSDPKQVPPGKFLALENTVFTTGNLLQKRNGYKAIASLPDSTSTLATTFNGNLTAIGTSFNAYSEPSNTWVTKGDFKPVSLDVLPLIRSNTNQSQADSAVSTNGLVCTVFTDEIPVMGTPTPFYKYVVADLATGQNVIAPTVIDPPTGAVEGSPRVFFLGNYFIIVFTNNVSATYHLQYIAISSTNLSLITTAADLSTQYDPETTVNFDGFVINNNLYLAWNGSDLGGAVRMTYLDSTLTQHNTVSFAGRVATLMSVSADSSQSTAVIYAAFHDAATDDGYVLAVNQQLSTVLAPTQVINGIEVLNITSSASNGVVTVFYEVENAYSYDAAIATNYISSVTCTQAGVVGTPGVVIRSLGLASKAFISDGEMYFLGIYDSLYQPTYFLVDSTGKIISKLAYSNGGSYYTLGLPQVSVFGNIVHFPYLIKDLVAAVNKSQNADNSAGVYSQTGINLATLTITDVSLVTSEIANNLNISGGFLWMYDGYSPVEQGFFLWPDYIELADSATGGFLTAQEYFYQVIYEWSDNQGNIFRSAPSLPVPITTDGTTSSVTIDVPTLRLTYKTQNPVKIVIFRWSTAQQTFYQVTSIANPLLNDTTTDSVSFVDTLADTSILGNSILYTTGGVVENIGPPATSTMTLFKSRLVLVDSEDKNLLWYSKQVIEGTPVEMSDLFTIFVAPTTAAQGSTGPITALSALDDKLVIFKRDAIYYITGNGPDNTGANNDFSEPVFITSTVGCTNQHSIVFMPQGLMFQSDKGIWLLDRNLQTTYIGSPVESFNDFLVESAVNIPGTNQVRFTLSNGLTLMYDYFFGQWGTFTNVPAISSTLFQNLHTYINSRGEVFQENPGSFLDGSNPVLMSFTTGWMNLAGLQGYERFYFFYMLGSYITPHKLTVSIGYDYSSAPEQTVLIMPNNYNPPYGSDTLYGSSSPYGGPQKLEQWRIFPAKQKCQAFQLSITEQFDATFGTIAGAGLTISGLDLVVGLKKKYTTIAAANSVG